MEPINLYLLSTYLKKWSYGDGRITLNYSFCYDGGYQRNHIDMRLGAPSNLVNEFLSHLFHRAKEAIYELKTEDLSDDEAEIVSVGYNNIISINESEIKRKLSIFFTKILKEFNHNKRSRGRSRMISTRSLDFYYNDFEFEPLEDWVKFYVHLNRGINKMNGDLWTNAIDDFSLALSLRPDDVVANKQIAQALSNLGRYKEALQYLSVYAEQENTPESLNALAQAYIQLEEYDKADEIYQSIEEQFSESLIFLFGRAQLAYKREKGYRQLLDRIYKQEPEWLKEKLKKDWEYKLPGYGKLEESMWNAGTAARYLGFDRPFDLTRRAFNDELPSYFDSEKGTIRFAKAELDRWVDIMNRYKLDDQDYQTFEDRLSKAELEKTKVRRPKRKKKSAKDDNNIAEETNAVA